MNKLQVSCKDIAKSEVCRFLWGGIFEDQSMLSLQNCFQVKQNFPEQNNTAFLSFFGPIYGKFSPQVDLFE